MDEEITTAALLAFIASNIAWTSALLVDAQASPLSWVHYSKHKKDKTSEAFTGADFSLVLRLSSSHYRAAIFQAKRSESRKLNFKHLHISPERDGRPPEPQIIRLRNYALTILSRTPLPIGRQQWDTKDLAFVHYLIYHDDNAFCSPLSDHAPAIKGIILKDILAKEIVPHSIDLVRDFWSQNSESMLYPDPALLGKFSELLKAGVLSPPTNSPAGWIELESKAAARSFIRETRLLMDVFEGAEVAELEPTLSNHANLAVMRLGRSPMLKRAKESEPRPSSKMGR